MKYQQRTGRERNRVTTNFKQKTKQDKKKKKKKTREVQPTAHWEIQLYLSVLLYWGNKCSTVREANMGPVAGNRWEFSVLNLQFPVNLLYLKTNPHWRDSTAQRSTSSPKNGSLVPQNWKHRITTYPAHIQEIWQWGSNKNTQTVHNPITHNSQKLETIIWNLDTLRVG